MNYYKDLWTNPNTEAGQFFNKTDFNHKDYKDQEQVFRNFLKGLKAVKALHEDQKPIETVLEVGIGTGRITKIVLEELPDIKRYDGVDIHTKRLENIPYRDDIITRLIDSDITSQDFDIPFRGKQYDLIIASEVFMHIKPEDIQSVLTKLVKLLAPNAVIVNIDWYHQKEPSTWCYLHDYDRMYVENALHPIFMMHINRQKLFCYGR